MHRIMLAFLLPVFLLSQPLASFAGDPAIAPVKAIMDATASNWAGGDSDWQDIFNDSSRSKLFSADFLRSYQAAQNYPASEDGISPFDYDVIVGGGDACPLENLTIAPQAPAGGRTEVIVRFQKSRCMGPDAAFQAFTEVRFQVLSEGGKPLVDDILTTDDDGKSGSLKAAMQDIVKQQ